jgi:bifunctional lysine-specific demethylase and histidyl-hydroxylase NO66
MTSGRIKALNMLTDRPGDFGAGWPKQPLVHHGDRTRARELLSFDTLDTLITESGILAAQARIAKEGNFAQNGGASRPGVPLDAVTDLNHLREGSTLLLSGVQGYRAPVRELCRELTAELAHTTLANCYLTPPGSQGFAYHWDGHSVFMIQTEGSKALELYRPIVDEPATPRSLRPTEVAAMRDEGRLASSPDIKVELCAGDVLWVPVGWIHNGYTTEDWSLHVTIGLQDITRRRLAEQLASLVVSDHRLDGRLPPGIAFDDAAIRALVTDIRDVMTETLAGLDMDRLTATAGTGLRTSLGPNVPRPVITAVALAEKGPSAVRLARGAVLAESGDGGTLHLGSADIDVPGPLIAEYQRARDNDGICTGACWPSTSVTTRPGSSSPCCSSTVPRRRPASNPEDSGRPAPSVETVAAGVPEPVATRWQCADSEMKADLASLDRRGGRSTAESAR